MQNELKVTITSGVIMRGAYVVVIAGLLLIGVAAAVIMNPVRSWATRFDRATPPAPHLPNVTPAQGNSDVWGGGEMKLTLLKDGSPVRRWSIPLSISGGGEYSIAGTITFRLRESVDYEVIVFASIVPLAYASSTPTATPTATSTWAPPAPPYRPHPIPLSIVNTTTNITVELISYNGSGAYAHIRFNKDISSVIANIAGKYGVSKAKVLVFAEIAVDTPSGPMVRYTDPIDIGTFVRGGVVSYEG